MSKTIDSTKREALVLRIELLTSALNSLIQVSPYREGPKQLEDTIDGVNSMLSDSVKELISCWNEDIPAINN